MFSFDFKTDYSSIHSIHPYPAKFPASVPKQLIQQLSKDNYLILDPFCGSGTTLIEGLLHNCDVIGNDTNYIALLISKVKTSIYKQDDFKKAAIAIENIINDFKNKISLKRITNFPKKEHWFQKNVSYELDLIKNRILEIKNERVKFFFQMVLSNIIIDVSNQESDTRYAAKEKNIKDGFTVDLFLKCFKNTVQKVSDFNINYTIKNKATILNEDGRFLYSIKNQSIDLIITSPPYANTYDYYLYHKHRMNWLDHDFNVSKNLEIGSRNEYSSKKRGSDKWREDIKLFIVTMKRVLKRERYACIIIGDSVIANKLINADELIKILADEIGMEYYYQTSVNLLKNSKKFNHKFRTKLNKKEHLIILKKV